MTSEMLFSVVFFISILVQNSLAFCPIVHYNATAEMLMGAFAEGASTVPIPTVEFGNRDGGKLTNDLIAVAVYWGLPVMSNVENQARAAGQQLIYDINEDRKKVERSIESIHEDRWPHWCDDDLNRVTIQLWKFLSLKPGQVIKPPVFTKLPEPIRIISQTKPRSLSELFLTLPEVINSYGANTYEFVSNLFLEGWRSARKTSYDFAMRIRRVILDDLVLDAYRYEVEKLLQKSDLIKRHVKIESWQSFTDAAYRVIQASNDYEKAKQCRWQTAP